MQLQVLFQKPDIHVLSIVLEALRDGLELLINKVIVHSTTAIGPLCRRSWRDRPL